MPPSNNVAVSASQSLVLHPLTAGQREVWFFQQLQPNEPLYNIGGYIELTGPIEPERFIQAIRHALANQDSLHLTLSAERDADGVPFQTFPASSPTDIPVIDVSGETDPEGAARALMQARFEEPFPLDGSPLFRFALLKLAEDRIFWLQVYHHLTTDGWGASLTCQAVANAYTAMTTGGALPAAAPSYIDFIADDRRYAASERFAKDRAYWLERFPAPVEPLFTPRGPVPTDSPVSGRAVFTLDPDVSERLHAYAHARQASVFQVITSALYAYFARIGQRDEIAIGLPVLNRANDRFRRTNGLFANVNAVLLRVDQTQGFARLLDHVQGTLRANYRHQRFPIGELVRALGLGRSNARLFDISLSYERFDFEVEIDGCRLTPHPLLHGREPTPLMLFVREYQERQGTVLDFAFNHAYFTAGEVAVLQERLVGLLRSVLESDETPLARLPMMTAREQALLGEWNATDAPFPRELTVSRLFEAWAEKAPEAEAVVHGAQRITYREINTRANRLAHRLIGAGAGPDTLVAIQTERSVGMIAGALAVMKAGAGYLPLAADLPETRRALILTDARPVLLLSDAPVADAPCPVLSLDDDNEDWPASNPPPRSGPAHLAYVIFTSGSTGQPKGVMIEQHSLVNMIAAFNRTYGMGPGDRMTQMASFAFDVSVSEIFPPLCAGGTVVIVGRDDLLDPERLTALLAAERISVFGTTPLLLGQLTLDRARLPYLRQVFSGGEALTLAHCAGLPPEVPLVNGYGPTEATIGVTAYRIQRTKDEEERIPIGRPAANQRVYVLDASLRPLPIGVAGELCIAGEGVARGYLNRPELTAEKFVEAEIFGRKERLYRTGDKARWLADGNLEFLGRIDRQIKLRGYRIELGEVEAALAALPGVAESAVVARGEGTAKRLIGYAAGRGLDGGHLKTALKGRLPDYMVPAALVVLDRLPVNANGKVDEKNLPEPDGTGDRPPDPPRTPIERMLADLWGELLHCEVADRRANFFDLGGHSLLATRLAMRIKDRFGVDVPLAALFEQPNLEATAACIADRQRGDALPPIERQPPGAPQVLSFAQQRLWFLEQLEGGSPTYSMPAAVRLTGALDREALRQSLIRIEDRHEGLRQIFTRDHDEPRAALRPAGDPLVLCDLSALTGDARERALAERIDANVRHVFDLATGPLFRAELVCLGEDEHVLLVNMHHIVSDGWSIEVLLRDWKAIYAALIEQREPDLPPLPIRYADYAAWQRQHLQGPVLQGLIGHWRAALFGAPQILDLPADHARPAVPSHRGGNVVRRLPAGLGDALTALGRREGATLFMTLLAAFSVLLARHSGQTDMLIGTPVANRVRARTEDVIGFFVNTLVLRARLHEAVSFADLLRQVRRTALDAYAHQELPFETLVEAINPDRSLSHTPLFQAMFSLLNAGAEEIGLPGVEASLIPADLAIAKFDLTLGMGEDDQGLVCNWEYAKDLFEAETIERMANGFETLLTQLVAEPEAPLSNLNPLTAEDEAKLRAWNATARDFPRDQTVPRLFEAQAAATPEAEAVAHNGVRVTYRDLNARANRLAHRLIAAGVGPDSIVGICLDRSVAMVVAALAVMKAGGAYVPLATDLPAERRALILADCRTTAIVSDGTLDEAPCPILDVDGGEDESNPAPRSGPDDLAYVIFTSGSTGRPKGVMIEQHSLVNMIAFMRRAYDLGAGDRMGQMALFGFDVSVSEIFPVLCAGGTLVIVDRDDVLDPERLTAVMESERITVIGMTPLVLAQMRFDQARLPHLRTLFSGAEALAAAHHAGVPESVALVNGYGPTEATIGATAYRLQRNKAEEERIPIGRPNDNTRIHILDAALRPLPIGVPGELCIAGEGVARGYLNQPDLTAEKFVETEIFGQRERLYRTGDKARWLADGNIEFLGRIDRQIKLRGYRIELGEIETALAALPDVSESAVVVRGEGTGKRLIGYAAGTALDGAALKAALKTRLPEYMVPAALVVLDRLPLTGNGKVDEKALPEPEGLSATRESVPPRDQLEAALAAVWGEVLEQAPPGIHDNFFELGGHSFRATKLTARLRDAIGASVPVRWIFESPTIAELADRLRPVLRGETADGDSDVPPNRIPPDATRITPADLPLIGLSQADIDTIAATVDGGVPNIQDLYPLSPLQEGILFHHQLEPDTDPYRSPVMLAFDTAQRRQSFLDAFQIVTNRHDILRTAVVWEGLSRPVQVVWRSAPIPIGTVTFDPADGPVEDQLRALCDRTPLDLTKAPMRRVLLADDGERRLLGLIGHHLTLDHTTLDVLMGEVRLVMEGQSGGLPPPVPYRSFIARMNAAGSAEAHEAFFKDMLGTVDQPTAPFGLLDVRGDGSGVALFSGELPAALARRLAVVSARFNTTPAAIFHLVFALMLARCCAQDDVVFGTVLFGRLQGGEGVERALGLFINTLPLRIRRDDRPLTQALRDTQRDLLALMRHEQASLGLAQRCSALPPPAPLFSALLNYRHSPERENGGVALEGVQLLHTEGRTNYPFVMSVDDYGDGFGLGIGTDPSIDPARVYAFTETALDAVLGALEQAPETPLCALHLLPPSEEASLRAWNATDAAFPRELTVPRLFEAWVEKTPDAEAVVHGAQRVTYRNLNARANRLAHRLIGAGAGPDTLVAIQTERSISMIAGALAVMKAGAGYLPLAADLPEARRALILKDARPVLLLSDTPVADAPCPVLPLDDANEDWPETNPPPRSGPEHLAYVIFTSGSTGQPKGVMIEQHSLVNMIVAFNRTYDMRPGDRITQMASFAFDVSVSEIFPPLCAGVAVVIVGRDDLLDPERLTALLAAERISVFGTTPLLLGQLTLDRARLPHLRQVFSGGEALTLAHCAGLPPEVPLVNGYGPTEATIGVTAYRIQRMKDEEERIPIGRPAANQRVYVLDKSLRPLPIGVAGELCIAGEGVARGYLNRPELTAEKFVEAELFGRKERLYRTGDKARWLADGNLEFLGRIDRQIKLRGYRIELGEIESALAVLPGVAESAVVVRGEGTDKRLIGYAAGPRLDADALKTALKARLPDYMVPVALVVLDRLPVNANGKLDTKALPEPQGLDTGRHLVPPRDELERTLAAVWAEVLGIAPASVDDSFFELGGHSFRATKLTARLRAVLGVAVPVRWIFEAPTLAEQAERLRSLLDGTAAGEGEVPPNRIHPRATRITPADLPLVDLTQAEIDTIAATVDGGAANIQDIYPLSPLQEGILYHHLLDPSADPYQSPMLLAFDTAERRRAFLDAVQVVHRRHDILRTAVVWAGLSQPVQVVWREAPIPVETKVFDPAQGPIAEQLLAYCRSLRVDPTRAPMRRVIAAEGGDVWLLGAAGHHLTLDHTTNEVLIAESRAIEAGQEAQLPVPVPFRNFIARMRQPGAAEAHEAFFTEMLGTVDHPTAPFGLLDVHGDGGKTVSFRRELPEVLAKRLSDVAHALDTTPAAIFHLVFGLLLARCAAQDDTVFGTVLFGRLQGGDGVEQALGLFINTLPLRIRRDERPLLQALRATRRDLLALIQHEQASLGLAQRCSALPAPAPLFSALLNYRHSPRAEAIREDAEGIDLLYSEERTNYPFVMTVDDYGDGFAMTADIDASIDAVRVCGYAEAVLETVLHTLEHHPDTPLNALAPLPPDEARRLHSWTLTEAPPLPYPTLPRWIEAQAAARPGAEAVVHNGETITYRALNERANRLAHRLIEHGVARGRPVGVCLERSIPMVVAALAVMKAGGAYVPLAADQPVGRRNAIIDDCKPVVLITSCALADSTAPCPVLLLDREGLEGRSAANPEPRCETGDLAYLIFTSGSTGQPKGVMIEHRSIANFIGGVHSEHALGPEDRVLQTASIGFDMSVGEMFPVLCAGGTLVIADRADVLDPERLKALMARQRITAMIATPLPLSQLRLDGLPHLRRVWCGGEAVMAAHLTGVPAKVPVFNIYGPTETTVWVTGYRIRRTEGENLPIGTPGLNQRVYVLDTALQPLPIGVPGELCIAGEGVARGYLNRPDLTAEKFVEIEVFGRRERVYRSGDKARWRDDGTLEFLGRIDRQIKLRGYRIELGEIEAALATLPGVNESAVVVHGEAEAKRLIGYAAGRDLDTGTLTAALKDRLPEYMVPSALVILDRLPLNANGKLDMERLPKPGVIPADPVSARPRNEREMALVRIWEDVLNTSPVGIHNDFFALGGHSLLAVRLMGLIEKRFGRTLPLATLFRQPTIAGQAELLEGSAPVTDLSRPIEIQPHGRKVPLYLLPGAGGHVLCFAPLASRLGLDQPSFGLEVPGLYGEADVPQTVEEHAARLVAALRAHRPHGPYRLLGHSAGGVTAFEMARILERDGEDVSELYILDVAAPLEEFEPPGSSRVLRDVVALIEVFIGETLAITVEELDAAPGNDARYELIAARIRMKDSGFDAIAIKRYAAVYEAMFRALCRYRPAGTVRCPITFVSAAASVIDGVSPDWGWRRLCDGPVSVRIMQGDHLSMLLEPDVRELARIVEEHGGTSKTHESMA